MLSPQSGRVVDMSDRLPGEPPTSPADREGFASEVLTHLDSLFSTALRLTRERAAAEDLVQDTCVKAFRFASRFERGTNLRAWLFTILHNTFRNDRRGAMRDPVEVDSEVVDEAAMTSTTEMAPDAALLGKALGTPLQAALDALPDAYRQAVWLRDVEEFSYQEIAQVLGVPQGTVMSRIARGRRMLYQRLATVRT